MSLSLVERTDNIFERGGQANKVSSFIFHDRLIGIMQDAISRLKELLAGGCRIEKVHPPIFASDAEVNLVIVSLLCPDGTTHTVRAYREEAHAVREYVRSSKM